MTFADSAIASIPFAEALLDEATLLPGLEKVEAAEGPSSRVTSETDGELAELTAEVTRTLLPEDVVGVGDRSVPASHNAIPEQLLAAAIAPDAILAAAEGDGRVLTVTTTSDEADGSATMGRGLSLRDAVLIANSTPGDDIIELESGQTYELTIAGSDPSFLRDEDPAALGDLEVAATGGKLSIRTTGEDKATIDANQIDRVFHVKKEEGFGERVGTLSLHNVTVTGGKSSENTLDNDGGGILVDAGARLEMSDCVVTGNTATLNVNSGGGGLFSKGIAQITRCTLTGNVAGNGGAIGGILDASIEITDSVISRNTASQPSSSSDVGSGGGIDHSGGLLNIVNSTIADNSAGFNGAGVRIRDRSTKATISNSLITGNVASGGGGVFVSAGADVSIEGSTIDRNEATRFNGGGIAVDGSSDTLTLSNSTLSNNTAAAGGGGIRTGGITRIRNVEISNNSAGSNGGGVLEESGGLVLQESLVTDNTAAGSGGGVEGGSFVLESTIRNNRANGLGGGVFTLDPGFILNSTISGNATDSSGGGLAIGSGPGLYTVTIANSTISGNSAKSGGGGLTVGGTVITDTPAPYDPGVGYTYEVNAFPGNVVITSSTITDNTADSDGSEGGDGGGISNAKSFTSEGNPREVIRTRSSPGKITLQNTIVAGNNDASPANSIVEPDVSGAVRGNANNLVGSLDGIVVESVIVAPAEDSLGAGSDLVGPDPGLGPLRDNGGPTQTHALRPGSPAIDAGDNTILLTEPEGITFNDDGMSDGDVLPFDQREEGFDRILNGTVDIGAFEGVDDTLPTEPPLVFEPSLDFIATTLAIATNGASEQTPEAANNLLGASDLVQPDDIPAPASIDYGFTPGVTVEDTALMLAAYSLGSLDGLDADQLASAASLLLGSPAAIAPDSIVSIPTSP